MSLPDCKSVEVHHWWASPPPKGTSILSQAMDCNYYSDFHGYPGFPGKPESLGLLDGLGKLERISLESPPELDKTILVQLLGHQDSLASNLKHLELRFCNLDPDIISKLIQQASPSLTHVTLLLGGRTNTMGYQEEKPPHLCPLIRDFSKNLVRLEFSAPSVCTEIVYDDDELREIRRNCNRVRTDQSDNYAIHEAILACRKRKKTQYRKECMQEAFREAGNDSNAHIETRTELLLDREEEQRKRLIRNSWKRKIISWQGSCRAERWAELQQGANLAEAGIEWTLASKIPPPFSGWKHIFV